MSLKNLARRFADGLSSLRDQAPAGLDHSASIPRDRKRYAWPDCEPIDKTDEFWEFNNNCSINGTAYHKVEVESGRWQWVINETVMAAKRADEQRRADLWHALRTRVLTDEEMAAVRSYGQYLNIREMVSYNATEKALELTNALAHQALMQISTARPNPSSIGRR